MAQLLLPTSQAPKGNSDFVLTPPREFVYGSVDVAGIPRQLGVMTELLATAPQVSSIASTVIPIALCFTGPACMATAAVWTIPDACDALVEAQQDYQKACQGQENSDLNREAKKAVEIAKLGLANHLLYFEMGAAQTASGIVTLLSPGAAHVFHYAPVLTGSAATAATMATSIALGAVYVVRGTVMLTRAVKNYREVRDFHNQFEKELGGSPTGSKTIFDTKNIDQAIDFMKGVQKIGDSYISRRVNESCLRDDTFIYTLKGKKEIATGKITTYDDTSKKEYLNRVHKGIYTEELKHKIAITIAVAMIVGGALAIILSAMTGGILVIVIGLVSALFFLSMESIYLTYDSSYLFNWLRDRLYIKPEWIDDPFNVNGGNMPETLT